MTKARVASFLNGYGTILTFEDNAVINGFSGNMPALAKVFPVWAENQAGMLQYVLWAALAKEGLGVSLQVSFVGVHTKDQHGSSTALRGVLGGNECRDRKAPRRSSVVAGESASVPWHGTAQTDTIEHRHHAVWRADWRAGQPRPTQDLPARRGQGQDHLVVTRRGWSTLVPVFHFGYCGRFCGGEPMVVDT
jgi:hypothetical protein